MGSEGRLLGKRAIVTGGAQGIGAAIACAFADAGAQVIITDLDAERAAPCLAELGLRGRFFHQDVRSEAGWEALFAFADAELGGVDILVNNAGMGTHPGNPSPEHLTLENWRLMQSVNGEGVFLGCRAAIGAMKRGGGVIINLSSIASRSATPHLTAYGFAKAGVEQLTRSVALYCARQGYRIRCNSVHPGIILTPMLEGLFQKSLEDDAVPVETSRERLRRAIPLGDFGAPADIAAAVLYLASDEARHVTGVGLVVDGGVTME